MVTVKSANMVVSFFIFLHLDCNITKIKVDNENLQVILTFFLREELSCNFTCFWTFNRLHFLNFNFVTLDFLTPNHQIFLVGLEIFWRVFLFCELALALSQVARSKFLK